MAQPHDLKLQSCTSRVSSCWLQDVAEHVGSAAVELTLQEAIHFLQQMQ